MLKHLTQTIVILVLVLTLSLSACQQTANPSPDPTALAELMATAVVQTLTAAPSVTPLPTSTSTATPTVTPTQQLVNYGPTNFPDNVNPLTGLEVEDPSILDRRPVMIKVANQLSGRPHAGLSSADIVFDYYVGNGGDRFVALYYGKDDDKIGTVRSGRMVDRFLVRMYGGILGMVSADERVLEPIMSSLGGQLVLNEHCDQGYQAICDDGSNTETSVFANSAEMSRYYADRDYADNTKQNLDGMTFATIPPEGGVPATQFTMHYGKNYNQQWNYDPATGKYLRWIDSMDGSGNYTMIPLVDRNTGEQLAFSNVVVIFAQLDVLNGVTDSIHEYTFAHKNGRALICRDGKVYDVFYSSDWNKPFSFYDADGNPFALQPGNTWIHLTGLGSKVEEIPAGVWMVSLRMP